MKKLIKLIILIIPIILISFLKPKAFASTNYNYQVQFDYECYKIVNTSSSLISAGNSVSYINIPNNEGDNGELDIVLKGNKNANKNILVNNDYINSTEITININTNYKTYYIYLYDGFKNEISSSKNKYLNALSLAEDNYSVKIICNGPGIYLNNREYYYYETICIFNFSIDITKPIINGASKSMNGKYVKNKINVSGDDYESGLDNIYMLEPGGTSYKLMGNSINFSSSLNGLFSFYAVDKAGNISNIYYLNNDIKIPKGKLYDKEGKVLNLDKTNNSFYYKSSDDGSGIKSIQYLKPNENYWEVYQNQIIDNTYPIGLYQFRTIDKVGNTSDILSIYYNYINPSGHFYDSNENIINNKKTNAEYFMFSCEDNKNSQIYMKYNEDDYQIYNNKTKLYKSGLYSFYIIDNCGNVSDIYTLEVDNEKPIIICDSFLYSITEIPFTISVNDNNDYQLYYKSPSMEDYKKNDKLYYDIKITDEIGKYYFYAIDSFNNKSDIVWIVFNNEKSDVQIKSIENSNQVFLTWTNPNYEVMVNSIQYHKGQILSEEGIYEVTIKNEFGNIANLSFDISCFYVLDCVVEANCIENGYTVYKCISCDKELYTNETSEGTHLYDQYYVEPTCTESGGIYNYCIKCGYGYMSNIIAPLGHNYKTYIYDNPKCIVNGIRKYYCENCEKIEYEIINPLGHDFYKYKEIKKNNNKYLVYKCERCGVEKQEKINDNFDILFDYVTEVLNIYFPYIISILIVTSSTWSIFMGIKIIVAKKNDEKEKAYKMIKNYIIGLIAIFILLGAFPYIIKLIISII